MAAIEDGPGIQKKMNERKLERGNQIKTARTSARHELLKSNLYKLKFYATLIGDDMVKNSAMICRCKFIAPSLQTKVQNKRTFENMSFI